MSTTLSFTAASRWRPPPFIWLSVALHALVLVAWVLQPGAWLWWLGVLAANHLAITLLGLIPRSHWLGDNICRLPAAHAQRGEWALTIDDGPDPEVTPAVLDVLDAYGVKATFFCIASRAQAAPALTASIVARGHSVQNHSHAHPHGFSLFGQRKMEQELRAAQATLQALTGQTPRYFRAPAGLRNVFLAPVLHRLNMRLVTWTRRAYDTREARAAVVAERLLPALQGGAILLLHDGHAARNAEGRAVILDVLPRLLDAAQARKLQAVTLPHALG